MTKIDNSLNTLLKIIKGTEVFNVAWNQQNMYHNDFDFTFSKYVY